MRKKNNGPPASPDSATFRQLWDALGSKLEKSTQGHLLYTQGVRGSSPIPPTIEPNSMRGQAALAACTSSIPSHAPGLTTRSILLAMLVSPSCSSFSGKG